MISVWSTPAASRPDGRVRWRTGSAKSSRGCRSRQLAGSLLPVALCSAPGRPVFCGSVTRSRAPLVVQNAVAVSCCARCGLLTHVGALPNTLEALFAPMSAARRSARVDVYGVVVVRHVLHLEFPVAAYSYLSGRGAGSPGRARGRGRRRCSGGPADVVAQADPIPARLAKTNPP